MVIISSDFQALTFSTFVILQVYMSRERRDVILSVDRVKIRDRIKGDFVKLNLDRQIYIGGAPHVEEGLVVFENFTGCIENMYLNHSNVISAFKNQFYQDQLNRYEDIGKNFTKLGRK